jgi:hypothetical protein
VHNVADLPLFAMPPMHRTPDHATSIDAAARVREPAGRIRQAVYEALASAPMTDLELERLPQFAGCAPSTVRKRRSELYIAGRVRATGERRGGANVWEVNA